MLEEALRGRGRTPELDLGNRRLPVLPVLEISLLRPLPTGGRHSPQRARRHGGHPKRVRAEPLQGLSVNAQDSVGGCGDLLFLQSPRQASYACRLLVRAAPAPSGMTDSLSVSPRPPCRGPSFTLHRLTHQRRRAGEGRKEPLSRQGRELRSRASPAAQR